MGNMITQMDLFRNADAPMRGVVSNTWGYGGQCYTAQAAVFHAEALNGLNVLRAYWRCCWQPNIADPQQTAIRLLSANSGPSNLSVIASTFSGGKLRPGLEVLNEAFDVTREVQELVKKGEMFQLCTQSAGNGSVGCLIFSSSIELILAT